MHGILSAISPPAISTDTEFDDLKARVERGTATEREEEIFQIREFEREKPITAGTQRALGAAFKFQPQILLYDTFVATTGIDPLGFLLKISDKISLPIKKGESDKISAAKTVFNVMKDIFVLRAAFKTGGKGIQKLKSLRVRVTKPKVIPKKIGLSM